MIASTIIGIGSHHGDDALGWHVVDMLQKKYLGNSDIQTIKCERSVLDWWNQTSNTKQWIFIDAIMSNIAAGNIHCIKVASLAETNTYQSLSSHGISLFDAIRLADSLGTLPQRAFIWGIEIAPNQQRARMSASVLDAIPSLISSIDQFLETDQTV
jgi:hydrogenase maturation protease